jgi:hypothetical protein
MYSSVKNDDMPGHGNSQSMLDSAQGWSAERDRIGEWLQLDLGSVQSVAGILVQGSAGGAEEWVTQFRVKYGSNQFQINELAGEFRGSCDAMSKVQICFASPFSARYVRILPLRWHGYMSMRAAVLVVASASQNWVCPRCTFSNDNQNSECEICKAQRPSDQADAVDYKKREDLWRSLQDAADLLIECRLVLAWSFVWAFFQEDEAQRHLFEFVQRDLEVKTEQLSDMIENRTTACVLQRLTELLDYSPVLRGFLEHIKEYTVIDPDMIEQGG